MVGINRLNNIPFCIEQVLKDSVEGYLIETGVWRGGSTIFMRAVLRSHGEANRTMWVADSFEGLQPPNERAYPADKRDKYHTHSELAVSLDDVKTNFAKYDMLDGQVRFLKGWFRDSLPTAPIGKLAVLRLDGDMYESTMDGLVHLYPKLSPGGYVIVGDYHWIPACRKAVTDYRSKHGINDEIKDVDWTAVYWRKSG
jgi:O-methyltransferase